jgi:hypothetical protein
VSAKIRQRAALTIVCASALALVSLSLSFLMNTNEQPVNTRTQTLTQELTPEPIVLECKQLTGNERKYEQPSPQIECIASVAGVFFWDRKNEQGNWQNFYYNQYPDYLTGFMFTTNPGELRIQFRDTKGNRAEFFLEVKTTYQECLQVNGCLRVSA